MNFIDPDNKDDNNNNNNNNENNGEQSSQNQSSPQETPRGKSSFDGEGYRFDFGGEENNHANAPFSVNNGGGGSYGGDGYYGNYTANNNGGNGAGKTIGNNAGKGLPDPKVYESRGKMFLGDGQNAQGESGAPVKKKKSAGKIVACVFGGIAIALGGYCAGYFSYDKEIRSLQWSKDKIQSQYYEEITDEQFYSAVFSAVNGLLDPYSEYMTAEQYADAIVEATGKWSGLGVSFSVKDESDADQLLIVRVSGNSPAENAGILAGTYILGFGDTEETIVESQSYGEMSVFLSSKAANQPFYLKLRKGKTGEPYTLSLAKQSFVENYVFYRSNSSAYVFTGDNATNITASENILPALDKDTAYIRLTQFNGQAADEFDQVMEKFKEEKKKNLILDLRSNGGGYLNILQEIASYFCKNASGSSPLVAIADYPKASDGLFKATGNKFYDYFVSDSRISVLADNGTASASECLIGCMMDYGAISYGDIYLSTRSGETKTYGKGIMQSTFPNIFGGDAIKLTTARILWPVTRNCIHARGVLPEDGAHSVAENYEGDAEILAAWEAIAK